MICVRSFARLVWISEVLHKYYGSRIVTESFDKSRNLVSYENLQTRYFLSGCDESVREVKANGSRASHSLLLVKILRYRHMEISRPFDRHFNLNVLHDNLKLTSLSADTRAVFFDFLRFRSQDPAHDVSLNKGWSEKCFSPVAVFIDLPRIRVRN